MERRKEVVFKGEIFVPRRGAADDAGRASQALLFGGRQALRGLQF